MAARSCPASPCRSPSCSARRRRPTPRLTRAMRNIKLTLSYDGTDFNGWQTQPGFRTIQETLEAAIANLTDETKVRVNACSRTDAGVHAVGQVVNFYTTNQLPCET